MQNEKTPQSKKKQQLTDYAKYSAMGFQMAAIIFAGAYGGFRLDGYLKMKFPVFTLVLTLTSVALALYFFIKDVIKKK